jgi:hypothetical protein
MDAEIFNKIKSFVVEVRGKYKIEFTRETQMEKDLKITGDDALEFFEEFGKRFKVDVQNLELSKYFAPEGSFSLYKLIFTGRETGRKEITLGDLERGIEAGKLDDSIINK